MADVITGIIGGAVGIGSALIGSHGEEEAAEAQAEAAQSASAWQEKTYYQTRADLAPWREAGKTALNTLTEKIKAGPGKYQESDYYNYLLESGTKALERGAAARGKQLSGQEQKALTQYGQKIGSADYQQWLQNWYQSLTPYQSLSGLGQTTSVQTGQFGQQTANQIGQNILAGGQAQAAGTLGQANTWTNLLQWGGQQGMNYGMYNALNQSPNAPNYIAPVSQWETMTWL